jgi:putative tryptophan/tyrosine transport system substrate-binding protein
VDAIFISQDGPALSAFRTIVQAANARQIPVYVSDTDCVEQGALAALGPNQYQVGLQTGAMVARVLQGEDICAQEVEFPKTTELFVNEDAAKICGIILPRETLAKAKRIVKSSK